MDQIKLRAIVEYVNEYKERLTGHWSENDQLMLSDLLEGYSELLEENKKLNKDKDILLEQGLSFKEYNEALKNQMQIYIDGYNEASVLRAENKKLKELKNMYRNDYERCFEDLQKEIKKSNSQLSFSNYGWEEERYKLQERIIELQDKNEELYQKIIKNGR